MKTDYGSAIRQAFIYLLEKYPECFIMGQGLWSPWYVGNTMTDLDKLFGTKRVVDTPVSESAVTGLGIGAAIAGLKPIIVHPRMDFLLYASDAIVNEAAKWYAMSGGKSRAPLTIRAIINRGGEQGAQHSQALHSWYMHIPGLRVVMPYSVQDARDLLISSVLSTDPVLYIDDRWLYDKTEEVEDIKECKLDQIKPKLLKKGHDFTIVAAGFSVQLAVEVCEILKKQNHDGDLFDLRILNPLDLTTVIESVEKTGRLFVIDGGWAPAGLSAEIITAVLESVSPKKILDKPARFTLPFASAPSAKNLEASYYPKSDRIAAQILKTLQSDRKN